MLCSICRRILGDFPLAVLFLSVVTTICNADSDNDGSAEILVSDEGGTVYCLRKSNGIYFRSFN